MNFILYWYNMWNTHTNSHSLAGEASRKNVYTFVYIVLYSTLLCRFAILLNQLIITHMTFGLFLSFKCYSWICCCVVPLGSALLCSTLLRIDLFIRYIVAYTNHEFIYLISFHVQIENQYHFRSIVCAAGKLEWRFQIGYYIKRRKTNERRKNQLQI